MPIVGIKRVGREGNTVSVTAAGRGTIGFEPQVREFIQEGTEHRKENTKGYTRRKGRPVNTLNS